VLPCWYVQWPLAQGQAQWHSAWTEDDGNALVRTSQPRRRLTPQNSPVFSNIEQKDSALVILTFFCKKLWKPQKLLLLKVDSERISNRSLRLYVRVTALPPSSFAVCTDAVSIYDGTWALLCVHWIDKSVCFSNNWHFRIFGYVSVKTQLFLMLFNISLCRTTCFDPFFISGSSSGLSCSRSFWYSRSLGLLAPVIHGMITYIQKPLEIREGVVWEDI
jgi:hypothetical protein